MTDMDRWYWDTDYDGARLADDGPFVLYEDAEAAIAAAENDAATAGFLLGQRDALAGAVQRVEALHAPYTDNLDPDPEARYCEACGTEWPCGTLAALRALDPDHAAREHLADLEIDRARDER